jgi:hypothetical protein
MGCVSPSPPRTTRSWRAPCARRCKMRNLNPEQLDYVNAHGTSTLPRGAVRRSSARPREHAVPSAVSRRDIQSWPPQKPRDAAKTRRSSLCGPKNPAFPADLRRGDGPPSALSQPPPSRKAEPSQRPPSRQPPHRRSHCDCRAIANCRAIATA